MKKYALYLPQFHTFEENDEWWGEGYTEWVNVKRATPLFRWHEQPIVPEDGYYDLSNLEEMEKQYLLAKSKGIDAFAVYHYWSNGKLLMQNPLENLIGNKSKEFRYYFTWANHNFYDKLNYLDKKLLWKQEYSLEHIHHHSEYLVRHFSDERYEKINEVPIFAIYDPKAIPNFEGLLAKYKEELAKHGVEKIHLRVAIKDHNDIEFINKNHHLFDSVYEYQPYLNGHKSNLKSKVYETVNKVNREIFRRPTILSAKRVSKQISKTPALVKGISYGFGIYVGWDTTPRWGNRGIIHKNFDQSCINIQKERVSKISLKDDFVVYTAWNEWGEGAVLEKVLNRSEYDI